MFIFVMAAAMETKEWPVAKPIFRTSTDNHHLHGERSDRKRKATSFEFFASLGRGTAKSKTEAMFFPKPRCDDGTTPPNFPCADGFISYTRLFKYLGSHIVPGLDSAEEIKIRIQKASQAFGCLSKSTFRIRTSANSSKDESTLHSSCRFFYTDVRRGSCERRSTICCGAFISHA